MEGIDQSRLEQFRSLEFLARQVVEGFITGLHKSPFHGFSVEFAEHRLYNTGESIRNIDWKLYGRSDRLYTKRYEEETNLRCQILIDNSSSMHFPVINHPDLQNPNKITFSVYISAALMYLFKKQRDASGLTLFSDKIDLHTDAKSSAVHHRYLIGQLENLLQAEDPVQTRSGSAVASAIHEIAERIHKRSLVVILSDMLDNHTDSADLFGALRHLKHNKHEVILFHVADQTREVEFAYENRPYRFVDLETGQQVKLFPSQVRDQYTRNIKAFMQEMKLKCGQYHIDLVEVDINRGFEQVLLPYLVKRSKLF